jgi:hypothetical protein
MSTKAVAQRDALQDAVTLINTQYGCGPVQFAITCYVRRPDSSNL